MNKFFKLTASILAAVFVLTGCAGKSASTHSIKQASASSDTKYVQAIKDAKKIEINENLISLGKKYTLYSDGKKIGEVTGRVFNAFGDTFTLKDASGKVLAKEKQIKRWHIKFNRNAVITDANGNITGYIGEETLTKIFSIGYFFEFYDKSKNEIGTSDQVNISLFKKNVFKNHDGSIAYNVNKNPSILKDSYDLNIIDSSKISVYQAIFMVCIEDAIQDSKVKNAVKKRKRH